MLVKLTLMLTLFTSCFFVGKGMAVFSKDRFGIERSWLAPVKWSFDCDFPDDMKDEVRDGFTYWNRKVAGTLFVEQAGCGFLSILASGVLVRNSYDYASSSGKRKNDDVTLGATAVFGFGNHYSSGMITLYRPWTEETSQYTRVSIVRHEIGHALGFNHGDDSDCLMYPYIDEGRWKYKDACPAELKKFHEHYGR